MFYIPDITEVSGWVLQFPGNMAISSTAMLPLKPLPMTPSNKTWKNM